MNGMKISTTKFQMLELASSKFFIKIYCPMRG